MCNVQCQCQCGDQDSKCVVCSKLCGEFLWQFLCGQDQVLHTGGRAKLVRPQAEIESSKFVQMNLRKACKSSKTNPQFILHDFDMEN